MAAPSTPAADRTPIDALLDVFVFAPLGFVLDARELVPKLAKRGRSQVTMLQVLCKFAMLKGKADADRILRARAQSTSTTATPSPPTAATPASDASTATVARTRPPARPQPGGDDALAIPNYDTLSASQILPRLASLHPDELAQVREYENAHRRRRTILNRIAQLQGEA